MQRKWLMDMLAVGVVLLAAGLIWAKGFGAQEGVLSGGGCQGGSVVFLRQKNLTRTDLVISSP